MLHKSCKKRNTHYTYSTCAAPTLHLFFSWWQGHSVDREDTFGPPPPKQAALHIYIYISWQSHDCHTNHTLTVLSNGLWGSKVLRQRFLQLIGLWINKQNHTKWLDVHACMSVHVHVPAGMHSETPPDISPKWKTRRLWDRTCTNSTAVSNGKLNVPSLVLEPSHILKENTGK